MPGVPKAEPGRSPALRIVPLLAVAILLLPLLPAEPAEAARITATTGLPVPILGTSSVYTGKDVFVFGGRSNQSYQATIVKVDPASGTSTTLPNLLPSGRQSTSAVWDPRDRPAAGCPKGCAYVFGGAELVQYQDPQFGPIVVPNSLRDIVRFNPQTGEVKKLADILPEGVWGTAAVWDASEDAAYIFGGFAFDYATKKFERKDWIVKFDPDADGVSQARISDLSLGAAPKRLPFPTQDAAVAIVGTKAYLLGGLTTQAGPNNTQSAVIHDGIVTFNLLTEQVTLLGEKLPYGTQFAPAVAVGGDIYVFGGRLRNASAAGTIIKYHATVSGPAQIFELGLPSVRYAMSATTDGASVWLLGGRDGGQNVGGLRDILTVVPGATEPTAPRDLRLAGCDGTGLRLTWTPPLYDGGGALTGYVVYRVDPDGITRNLSTTTTTAYTDGTTRPGTAYTYRVTALNGAGESRGASEVSVTACLRAPSEARAFEAYAGNGVAYLRWLPPTDSGGATIVQYRVYRNSSQTPLDTVVTTRFNDTTAKNGVKYTYSVTTFGGSFSGPSTPVLEVTPSDKLPATPTGLAVGLVTSKDRFSVSWSAADRATGYIVRYGRNLTGLDKSLEVTGATSATLLGIQPGFRYYIDVLGTNGTFRGPPSSIASAAYVTAPSNITELQAMPGAGYIRLQWTAPASNGGASSVIYKILRNESGVPATAESAWTGTAWIDRNVTGTATYVYRVVPYVIGDNSAVLEARGASTASVKPLVAANEPPIAELFVKPGVTADALVDLTFEASSSSDPDGFVRQYFFDFGDGIKSGWVGNPTILHRYAANGIYTATVLVKDDRGAQSIRAASVQIVIGPVKDQPGSDAPPSNVTDTPVDKNPAPKGTGFLGLPGPSAALAAAAAVIAALARIRRRA